VSWKLVFVLSLFGLAMGVATVFVISPELEPWIWLGILVVCAVVIAKRAPSKDFVHGLLVCILNSIWITGAHVAFFDRYIAGHPREAAMVTHMSSPKTMMLITGPIVGIASGLVLGLLAFVLSKFLQKSNSEYAGW
jgi:hypothetical protein